MEDLEQAAHGLLHRGRIAALDVRAEAEVSLRLIEPILLPQGTEGLGEVVGDEAVPRGQHVLRVLWDLPAREVELEPVEDREIELLRERLEEVGGGVPDQRLHGLVQVADEDQ